MKTIIVGSIALVGSLFAISNAQALSVPAGLAAVIQKTNPVEDVAYVCRRVWRCGPYGCGWGRRCWETGYGYGPGYGYAPGAYGYGGYRGYNPGWNPYWSSSRMCPPHYTVQDGVCKPYRGF